MGKGPQVFKRVYGCIKGSMDAMEMMGALDYLMLRTPPVKGRLKVGGAGAGAVDS